jgi:excisionase family DNA binding protein
MDAASTDKLTLTIPEAGKLLGIGRCAAYEAARKGELPTLKFGRRLVVSKARLDALLRGEANGCSSPSEAAR